MPGSPSPRERCLFWTQLRQAPVGFQKATSAHAGEHQCEERASPEPRPPWGPPGDRASAVGRDSGAGIEGSGVHVQRRRQRRAGGRTHALTYAWAGGGQGRAGAAVTEDWSRASRPVSWMDLVLPDAPGPGRDAGSAAAGRGPAGGAAAAGRSELLHARLPHSCPSPAPLLSSRASPAVLLPPHLLSSRPAPCRSAPWLSQPRCPHPALSFPSLLSSAAPLLSPRPVSLLLNRPRSSPQAARRLGLVWPGAEERG